MKPIYQIMILIAALAVTVSACLEFNFGEDEETALPTESQVTQCRAEMYLKDTAKITPLGYKLEGSGIDDRIWFKFQTAESDLAQIFDSAVVDVTQFEENVQIASLQGVSWWDVTGKNLSGGQIALPNARFMTVAVEKLKSGYIIYIVWHET
ncbi:MAG: hypothetical protein IT310_09480 [Anaerolineales bacterium]|nr:hypothetical protein [Anaerolineales bacterium]